MAPLPATIDPPMLGHTPLTGRLTIPRGITTYCTARPPPRPDNTANHTITTMTQWPFSRRLFEGRFTR